MHLGSHMRHWQVDFRHYLLEGTVCCDESFNCTFEGENYDEADL